MTQALVDSSPLANPRRVTLGLEQNRLSMLLAVLHRHAGIAMYDQDVYVNVVGGVRITETAADLPVLLAVISSLRDRPLPGQTAAFGEVGLSGEIRPVTNGQERIREAAKHGFTRIVVPWANQPREKDPDVDIVPVKRLADAIEAVLGAPLARHTGGDITAPGQLSSHYAPGARVRLNAQTARRGELLLGFGPMDCDLNLSERGDLVEAAANLFRHLHLILRRCPGCRRRDCGVKTEES